MVNVDDFREVLQPLMDLLRGGQHFRVLARPGRVQVDRLDGGMDEPGIAWSKERHEALQHVSDSAEGVEFLNSGSLGGFALAWVDDVFVLECAPDPMLHTSEYVRANWLSPLAGRFLSGSLGLGKNILLAGADAPTRALAFALAAEGKRPAVRGFGPAPAGWMCLTDDAEARLSGCDRHVVVGSAPEALYPLLASSSGMVATLDARRLDRTLVRFEAAIETALGRAATPVNVLSAIDLVVVLGATTPPRVREIAEIVLTEEGYRPRLLFVSGVQPVPAALIPVAAPSFLDDMALAGQGVLADELRHVGASSAAPSSAMSSDTPPEVDKSAVSGRQGHGKRPRGQPQPTARAEMPSEVPFMTIEAMPSLEPNLDGAPPPGWELDQLPEEAQPSADSRGTASYEAAALAATYGLGPPPPPAGTSPNNFEEALRQAQAHEGRAFKEGRPFNEGRPVELHEPAADSDDDG